MPPEDSLPHSAIVGAVRVSHALPLADCDGVEPWAFGPVVNVIDAYCRLATPVAHKGALSIWRLDGAAREGFGVGPIRAGSLTRRRRGFSSDAVLFFQLTNWSDLNRQRQSN